MTRRPAIAAIAIAAAVLASACGNYTSSSDVARVDGETLTIEELRGLMPAFTGAPAGETVDGIDGINFVGNGAATRGAIQYWVTGEIAKSSLEGAATEVPTTLIDQVRGQLETVPAFGELPDATQELVVELESTIAFFFELPMAGETFVAAAQGADVFVSPRFGTFTPPVSGQGLFDTATVVPLQ